MKMSKLYQVFVSSTYEDLIEQGHVQAQFNLGIMYSKGQGVTQDYEEAVKWKLKAVEKS